MEFHDPYGPFQNIQAPDQQSKLAYDKGLDAATIAVRRFTYDRKTRKNPTPGSAPLSSQDESRTRGVLAVAVWLHLLR